MDILLIDSRTATYVDDTRIEQELFGPGATIIRTTEPTDSDLAKAAGIVAYHSVAVDERLLSRLGECRAIVKATIGIDDVDLAVATRKGILCANLHGVGAEEVADHTMAFILSAQRKLFAYSAQTKSGTWSWRGVGALRSCRDTVLGLIGFGAIGRAVAERAVAFGYQVRYVDPAVDYATDRIRPMPLQALLAEADILSIHMPLTEASRGCFDRAAFERCKRGVCLVNTSRGALVRSAALEEALALGQVSAAYLDVLDTEPHPSKALREDPRVVLTPHAAFYSERSLHDLRRSAASALRELLTEGTTATLLNKELIQHAN